MSNGTFPPPIQLGPRAVGWLEHEIDEWIASRPRARLVPVVTPGPKGNFDARPLGTKREVGITPLPLARARGALERGPPPRAEKRRR